MRKIENEEQLLAFVQEQTQWLAQFSKDSNKFLKENLTEDEIKEFNVIIEDAE